MAFKIKGRDWQTEKGFTQIEPTERAAGIGCLMCQSTFNLGKNPEGYALCELHSNCSPQGLAIMVQLRAMLHPAICSDFWKDQRLNSYDRDAFIPFMDLQLLLESVDYTLKNCRRINSPASTYDEALQLYASEMAQRLRAILKAVHFHEVANIWLDQDSVSNPAVGENRVSEPQIPRPVKLINERRSSEPLTTSEDIV